MKKYIVITTINEKTKALSEFEKLDDWHLVIVGDKKSKPIESNKNLTFLSVDDQQNLGFATVDNLPYNHYTRKNIGYLYAIREGADVIYDTDDDNIPYPYWGLENFECAKLVRNEGDFINIYSHFSDELVWPRGFPLDLVSQRDQLEISTISPVKVGVWQGLADLDPDVDAIYRLVFNKPVTFERKEAVALPPGRYCPFNSQNTFWTKEAFPFLYLPATTSFRFTDILRGFIAQRLLWNVGMHLGFHEATVFQERNVHDFMKDFRDEIECYLNTKPVIEALKKVDLSENPIENMRTAYAFLHSNELISLDELSIVEAWLTDLGMLQGQNA
jgi:hypothetical protein